MLSSLIKIPALKRIEPSIIKYTMVGTGAPGPKVLQFKQFAFVSSNNGLKMFSLKQNNVSLIGTDTFSFHIKCNVKQGENSNSCKRRRRRSLSTSKLFNENFLIK